MAGTDCSGPISVTNFTDNLQSNGCDRTLIRTFSVFDVCNNTTVSCDLVYTWIEDTVAPQVTCSAVPGVLLEDLGCNPLLINGIPTGIATTATATDNCLAGAVSVTLFSDQLSEDGCNRTLVRTWSQTDNCNNTGTCAFTYTWIESTGPSLDCSTAPIVVSCGETPQPLLPNASALCGLVGSITATFTEFAEVGLICNGAIGEFTYSATDICGVTATCTQSVQVVSPEPTITCPADFVIACPSELTAGIPTVTDLCGFDFDILISDPVVISGTSGCDGAIYAIGYSVANHPCGITTACIQNITLETVPAGQICSSELEIVECIEDIDVDDIVYVSSCGVETVLTAGAPVLTSGTFGCNASTYTVTLTGTLVCGDIISCERLFALSTPASIIECPELAPVSYCDIATFEAPSALAFAACIDEVSVPGSFDIRPITCTGGSFDITYFLADACGPVIQTCAVTVLPGSAPVITCPEIEAVDYCDLVDFEAPSASVVSGCGAIMNATGSFAPPSLSCTTGGTFNVTYAFVDACGTSSTVCAVTVLPGAAPSIACPVIAAVEYCDLGSFVAPPAQAVSGCGDVTFVPGAFAEDLTCAGGNFAILYTLTDACGSSSIACAVTVNAGSAPTIACPTIAAVEFCNLVDFVAPFATAVEGCGATAFVPGLISQDLTCAGGFFDITYTFTDNCGTATAVCAVAVTAGSAPTITCPAIADIEYCDLDDFEAPLAQAISGCGVDSLVVGSFAFDLTCAGGIFDIIYTFDDACGTAEVACAVTVTPVSYTHLTLPTTPYV